MVESRDISLCSVSVFLGGEGYIGGLITRNITHKSWIVIYVTFITVRLLKLLFRCESERERPAALGSHARLSASCEILH